MKKENGVWVADNESDQMKLETVRMLRRKAYALIKSIGSGNRSMMEFKENIEGVEKE